jgi:hypothetical protein
MPKIADLFKLEYGHSLELNRLEQTAAAEGINFVGRAARNNGVTARVRTVTGVKPAPAGTVSVALGGQGGAGMAFLQPFPYYCGRDVMILTPKKAMTEQEILWWVTCISANRFRFGFGRQANRTLKDLELPDETSIPPWVALTSTDRFQDAALPAKPAVEILSTEGWQAFAMKDLFDIRKGQRLTKASMLPGPVPYVGASDAGNGITARVGQKPIHQGGTISVSYNGSVAEAFYQPEPYWATDDVNVLYPKGFELTPAIGLFLCALIRKEKYRFNYGRKWHLERMKESVLRLPTSSDGNPDWDYLERYINGLRFSSQIGKNSSSEH